jgi:hypothetical protein
MNPAASALADPADRGSRLTSEQRTRLDQAVTDIAAGRAIVVPLEDAPCFLATLAAITKLHRCEDLNETERGLIRAWEPELTPEDFAVDAEISGEDELARLLESA